MRHNDLSTRMMREPTTHFHRLGVLSLSLVLLFASPALALQDEGAEGAPGEAGEEPKGSDRVTIGAPLSLDPSLNPITFKEKPGPEIDDAELDGLEGKKVVLSLTVDKEGGVTEATLLKSTAPGASINDAMVEVAKKWKLDPPTTGDGSPVDESNWTVVVKIKKSS